MALIQLNDRLKIYKNQKYWWFLIIGGIIGAIFGLLLNFFLIKPLYSAKTSVSVVINFYQVGHLTQYEQDQYIGHLIIYTKSDDVLDAVIEKLNEIGNPVDLQSFKKTCFTERNLNEIIFRCVDKSPEQAKLFVDIWGEIAYSKLSDALVHGRNFEELMSRQKQLENCLELSSYSINSNYYCQIDTIISPELTASLEKEFELSKGLFSGISVSPGASSTFPDHAIRNNMNTMVLSGAILGLIISVCYCYYRKNDT